MSNTTTTQLAGDQLAPVLARLAHLPELRAGHDAGRRGESVPIEYRRIAGKVRGDFGFPQVAAELLNAEHELLLATTEPQRGIGRFESVRRARHARAALIEREPRVAAFVLGWELGKARIPLPAAPAHGSWCLCWHCNNALPLPTARCSCARHDDGSVTTFLCPVHADNDPCATMARTTGKRRKGSVVRGVCSACGWTATVA